MRCVALRGSDKVSHFSRPEQVSALQYLCTGLYNTIRPTTNTNRWCNDIRCSPPPLSPIHPLLSLPPPSWTPADVLKHCPSVIQRSQTDSLLVQRPLLETLGCLAVVLLACGSYQSQVRVRQAWRDHRACLACVNRGPDSLEKHPGSSLNAANDGFINLTAPAPSVMLCYIL